MLHQVMSETVLSVVGTDSKTKWDISNQMGNCTQCNGKEIIDGVKEYNSENRNQNQNSHSQDSPRQDLSMLSTLSPFASLSNGVTTHCLTGNLVPSPTTNKPTVTDNGASMQSEEQRLRTFTNWPLTFISKNSLAEDGFYYTGSNDVVRCAYCKIEIGYWEIGDNPNAEHKRWNPNCPLIKGAIMSSDEESGSNSSEIGMDDCGFSIEHGQKVPEVGLSVLNTLGIESGSNISYPKFAVFEKRLESFRDWPMSMKQRPRDLASAGFYYTGVGDQTMCFHCGIGLKDWEHVDEPWEEHALWSPNCLFLRLQKGAEYISQVVAKSAVLLKKKSNYDGLPSTSNTTLAKSACSSLNINLPEPNLASSSSTSSSENCNNQTNPSNHVQTKDQHQKCAGNVPLCGICYANERSVIYLPCRHLITCVDCCTTVTNCPVCRQEVKAYVKAFLS